MAMVLVALVLVARFCWFCGAGSGGAGVGEGRSGEGDESGDVGAASDEGAIDNSGSDGWKSMGKSLGMNTGSALGGAYIDATGHFLEELAETSFKKQRKYRLDELDRLINRRDNPLNKKDSSYKVVCIGAKML